MRKSVVFLAGGAVILLAAAGVLRFATVPEHRIEPGIELLAGLCA